MRIATSGMIERAGSKVYFDSMVPIVAFEGDDELSQAVKGLFARFRNHPKVATTSKMTLAEVLGKEARAGWAWQTRFYLNLLVWSGFVDLRPVTRAIPEETGSLRRIARQAGRRHKLPDAIHLVTAHHAGCTHLITGDKGLAGSVPFPMTHVPLTVDGLCRLTALLDA